MSSPPALLKQTTQPDLHQNRSLTAGSVYTSPSYWANRLRQIAYSHPCASHPLFAYLESNTLSPNQVAGLLRNYDTHATVLRRLLLQAATLMPEEAVGYILENVRNEYGNGDSVQRHQLQLIDVALQAGVSRLQFDAAPIQNGVKDYIKHVQSLYYPVQQPGIKNDMLPAVVGGAIAGTELLALREFQFLQIAFSKLGLGHHIWFNHVEIEADHCDESLGLALFFIDNYQAQVQVEFGLTRLLSANMMLYDGLLTAVSIG